MSYWKTGAGTPWKVRFVGEGIRAIDGVGVFQQDTQATVTKEVALWLESDPEWQVFCLEEPGPAVFETVAAEEEVETVAAEEEVADPAAPPAATPLATKPAEAAKPTESPKPRVTADVEPAKPAAPAPVAAGG